MKLLNVTFEESGRLLLLKADETLEEIAEVNENGLVMKAPAKFTNDINIDNNVLNMNAADSGIGFYSSGGGEYPYWRFHANGEMAWIHHWDKDGNIGMPLQFNSDNSIAAINKFSLGDGGLDGSNGLLEICSSNEASVAYMPNNYDKWVVGANCAGLANCFVWYDSSNGGTRAYIDRNGNFLTAGSIQCGSGGYVLPANANETQKIMFERPSNYEYAARMDLIRNSLRIYTYNRSGTYEQPFTLTLDDGIVSTSGGFYGPTLKYTGLWSGTLTSGSITLTNGMKYSALMIWGSPGSDSYKSMCVVPAGGLGAVQLTSNTAWIGFTTAASGNNITLTINGGSGKIYYVWGLVRHSA